MRIRTIKPEFWQSESMSSIDPFSRLMAIALLNLSDDHGYFNGNPAVVRGEVFPFEESLANVSRALAELSRIGYIRIGTTSAGKRVGNVVNFKSHQKVDHPSRLTFDVDSIVWDEENHSDSRGSRETSPSPREILDQERGAWSVEQGTGSVEKSVGRGRARRAPFCADEFDVLLPENLSASGEFLEYWHTWNEYRNEKGKRNTLTGAKEQIKTLSALSVQVAIATIQNSIAAGWTGLFPKSNPQNGFHRPAQQPISRSLPTC